MKNYFKKNTRIVQLTLLTSLKTCVVCILCLFCFEYSAGSDHKLKLIDTFQAVNISFTKSGSSVPAGYLADNGLAYSSSRGYGWVNPSTKAPLDMTASARARTGDSDPRLNGLLQMQAITNGQQYGSWQYAVPNGTYRVTIGAGDESYYDSDHQINAEGFPVISDLITTVAQKHKISIAVVTVSDGMLNIDATGGVNSKINFIIIAPNNSVTDTTAPTASIRLVGTAQSPGVYTNQVQVFATATDAGGAGLSTFQYSINGGSYIFYTQPFLVQTAGSYSMVIKATDANNNQFISTATAFIIPGANPGKSTGAYMVLQNLNNFPSNTHLAFSYLQTPWRRTSPDTTPYNANHNIVKLRINNKGTGSLTLSKLTLSRPGSWSILAINTDSTAALPVAIAAEGYVDISIQFKTLNAASRVKIFHDTLTIASNDSIAPSKKVMLDGLWQLHGEGLTEPWTQEIFDLYDFTTNTGYDHDDNGLKGSAVVPNSSEVPASYFIQADPSKPVTVYEIAQYHGCCNAVSPLTYYVKGTTTTKTLFTTNNLDGQSVLPREIASNSLLCVGTFNSSSPFGFTSDYAMYSDRTKNYQGKIGIRFWKVLDASGNIVPNMFLAGVDYLGTQFSNSDYNDDVYLIQNIKPDSGSVFYSKLIATPEDVNFSPAVVGASVTLPVNLFNSGKSYPVGSADPSINITGITITGPNASEFSYGSLASATLAIQTGTILNVNFNPQSLGIKNAALIVSYGTSAPLRIPLYGIANTSTQTIASVKRYKGGSDANVTITNLLWSSDKAIRQGSDELDKQAITSAVDCTVADSLYQTYLSATANLATTNYQIPVTNGTYLVRMHFVENYFNVEGGRIFNISIENQPALLDFDIYKEVGYRAALVKDFTATVTDGNLSIKFTPTVNRVALAGLEIYQATSTGGNVKALKTDSLLTDSAQNKISVLAQVHVFPNPGNGSNINVSAVNFGKFEKVNYTIHTMFGQVITKGIFMTNGDGTAQVKVLPVPNLRKGIYVINSTSSSGQFNAKFIIE